MADDIEIIDTALDKTAFVNNNTITTEEVFDGVDTVLDNIRETGDFEQLGHLVRSTSSLVRMVGWGTAKALHGGLAVWKELGNDEDDYVPHMRDITKLSDIVIERYIIAWEARNLLPQIADELVAQPIKNGIALGATLEQGYEPTEKQIEQLAGAKSNSEFLAVLREVKNKPARKSSLTIYLEPDGSLHGWKGGEHRFGGDLDIASDDPIVKAIVKRIVDGAGIIWRKNE